MKLTNSLYALLALLPLASGANPTGCLEPADIVEGKDYFPDKSTPLASESWDIKYNTTYKILQNKYQGTSYLLYQCGTQPPTEELVDGKHAAVIAVPLQAGVAITQTTMIPNFELLGIRTQIRGYLGNSEYVSSPCVEQLLDDGSVVEVSDPSNATILEPLLEATGPDLVAIVSEWDNVAHTPQVVISEYKEASIPAIYEWIKVYGALYNLEGLANELYANETANFECVAGKTAQVTETKTVVLWGYYSTYESGWDPADCPNWYCEVADECSAELLQSRDGSIEGYGGAKLMTIDEFVEFGKDAPYWIFPSDNWDEVYAANKEQLDQFESVKNKEVYDYLGRGQNAWFEDRLAEFDVVTEDFCQIVFPQYPIHQRVWLRNVFTEEAGLNTVTECPDVNAPLEVEATECLVTTPTESPVNAPTTSAAPVLQQDFLAAVLLTLGAVGALLGN